MADDSDLENLILRVIERWYAGRYTERHGLVTSYDPVRYLAKVTYQPEGQESGWLPIETGHIGNGYGIAIGLEPGDGVKTGDQVVVRHQEGDFEGGKIVQRVHSDMDVPPTVQSGEMVLWTKWGQKIYAKNDGTLSIMSGQQTNQDTGDTSAQSEQQNAKQVTIVIDPNGNYTLTAQNNHTNNVTENVAETIGGNHTETTTGNKTTAVTGSITIQSTENGITIETGPEDAITMTPGKPGVLVNGNMKVSGVIIGNIASAMG